MPIVATATLALLHVPPVVVLVSVVPVPIHVVSVPPIAAGSAFTVTTVVAVPAQPNPLVTVYVITVVPADTPVTTPVAPTVATPALLLLHVPPVVALARVVVPFEHIVVPPVIAATVGSGFTVITLVAVAVPQPLVMV